MQSKLVITLLLAACGATFSGCQSTSVLPAGTDTYTLTANAELVPGKPGAQKLALTAANQYCAQRERTFLPVKSGPSQLNVYIVTFRCLLPNDPELQRPNMQPTQATVIEDSMQSGQ